MTDDHCLATVRARLGRAVDILAPGLLRNPELAAHLRLAVAALRGDDPAWIRVAVVYREVAQALKELGGSPRGETGKLVSDAIDEWLTELERRA